MKHNRREIQELKDRIGCGATAQVLDSGSAKSERQEIWISFSEQFISQLGGTTVPSVTVTANRGDVVLYVTDKTAKGFKVADSSGKTGFSFDWIAVASVKNVAQTSSEEPGSSKVAQELLPNLRVPEEVKQKMRDWVSQRDAQVRGRLDLLNYPTASDNVAPAEPAKPESAN